MKRQQTIEDMWKDMQDLGRASAGKSFEQPKGSPTHAQIGIMFVLSCQEGTMSIKALAERFHTTSSAVTQLVNGLVKEGLIVRSEDKKDRRKTGVELTALGRKKIAEAGKQRLELMTKALAVLSDAELLQMKKIMSKITQHLKTIWIKTPHHN